MTYHTRLFISLLPGAVAVAFVVYITLWAFEALDVIITLLQEGTTP